MAGKGRREGVSICIPALRQRIEFTPGRRVLALLVFLLPAAAFALWSASDPAHACDPVTGEGCDTTPPSSGSPPTQPPATTAQAPRPAPPPRPPATSQQPVEPSIPAGVPEAPVTTAAPEPPTTASDETSTPPDDSGGGVPWKWGLLIPAVALGAVGVGAVARSKKKTDPLEEYGKACAQLCYLKEVEPQAEADVAEATAQLAAIDDAWKQARDYLFNRLRQDYIDSKRNRAYGTAALIVAGGPLMWLGFTAFGVGVKTFWPAGTWDQARANFTDPAQWNADVNEQLISGQALIDGIHDQQRGIWEPKLQDAQRRLDMAFNGRHEAESRLAYLRGYYPDTTFPECECGK